MRPNQPEGDRQFAKFPDSVISDVLTVHCLTCQFCPRPMSATPGTVWAHTDCYSPCPQVWLLSYKFGLKICSQSCGGDRTPRKVWKVLLTALPQISQAFSVIHRGPQGTGCSDGMMGIKRRKSTSLSGNIL